MQQATIEHVNVTVSDPQRTATQLCELFDWKIRWEGPALAGGYTVHVGTNNQYVAIYSPPESVSPAPSSYSLAGGLNHVGVHVDDLDACEQRVIQSGFEPNNHGDYSPGRRFYFRDHDDIEYEVVSYREEH